MQFARQHWPAMKGSVRVSLAEIASRGSLRERPLPLNDDDKLDAALRAAHLPTLLMAYAHLSRDEAMLDAFAPHIHTIDSGKITQIPDDLADTLRQRMRAVLTTPGAAVPGTPDARLLQKIMSAGMGEPVSAEFIPLLLEQTGLGPQPDRSHRPARSRIPAGYKVLVIGAGLSGLVAGIKLAQAGHDYEIIEKASEVGGTWWTARYPGAGVDTASHFYSFSFEQTPEWSTYTPKSEEMRDYLIGVSHRYGLRDHIRFETTVGALRWIADRQVWEATLHDANGTRTVHANAIINAHGRLSRWSMPAIPGLEDFAGPVMHTADWDDGVDLAGKRVALIGTGASGAQCGPAIVDTVSHLTVFQRSGHWVVPNANAGAPVPEAVRWAMRHIPHYLEWFRFGIYWTGSDGLYANLIKDPDWPADSPSVSFINEQLRQYCLHNLNTKLKGRPDLIARLTPDSPVFSKRIVMDTQWVDMFTRDDVTLVSDGIARIERDTIVASDGSEHPTDAIVLATGYDVARMLGSLDVIGRDGRNLRDEWGDEDPVAYFGLMVPGFPNYFHILGPNSAPNHGAGVNLVAEAQVNYILECLDHVIEAGGSAIEPTEEAFVAFNERVQGQMPKMIWTHPKANSYYRNSKGRVIGSWPFRLLDYWTECRGPVPEHFHIHQRELATEPAE